MKPNGNLDLFTINGYLHLPSMVDKRSLEKLILRIKELSEKNDISQNRPLFKAGDDQSLDAFFLASAHNISFFFDKNAPQKQKNNFRELNKVGHALHNLCPVFTKFSHDNRWYKLMTELGLKKPSPIQSMFIFKQAYYGDAVPAHQDATFLYTEPDSVIGLWFALEDADENNGCLWVLPGGHKETLKHRFVRSSNNTFFTLPKRVNWPRKQFIPLPAKAGDIIVLHGYLPHLSEINRSHKTRFAYTLHFIDRSCHYPKSNWLAL